MRRLLAALVLGLIGCREPQDSAPVRIGYQKISLYQHVFVAAERGLFEREGVNVQLVPFPSANRMMEALQAGEIEVAGLTNVQVAAQAEARAPGNVLFGNFLVWKA